MKDEGFELSKSAPAPIGGSQGAVLEQFWEPKWLQNREKIESKTDFETNSILKPILDQFLVDF